VEIYGGQEARRHQNNMLRHPDCKRGQPIGNYHSFYHPEASAPAAASMDRSTIRRRQIRFAIEPNVDSAD
jgi:hypothetical protein